MSISGVSDLDRLYKKTAHRRKDSGELDVFEATMYFYGGTQVGGLDGGATTSTTTLPQKTRTIREELRQVPGGRRMSLDLNMRNINPIPPLQSQRAEKQIKEKKYKQPMSPGGRLASFLNSLFNQKSSKKKKSQSVKDHHHEEETNTEGMRRRSSVSHFGSLWTSDSKSLRSSSSSGFRTPPHAKNPTKAHKDLRRNSTDIRHVSSLSNNNRKVINRAITMASSEDEALEIEKRKNMDLAWLDEKLKLIDGLSENKKRMSSCNGLFKKDKIWVDDEDDGAESDSSSDLFELQNYDLGLYSSGLPVYETTHIESIKRGPPISSGPF
ncbi:hypothetical protein BVC80_1745g11 [Macleaya cordata]|uniref:Protein BIG GRAIN 1-like E n=1 Tax=Macleaya cordata TaxID=56857 RepID=A0A200QKI5_MACCD|nr:hypothetical protein BVC80_1745g11 [Macleaya cordata]